MLAGKKIFKRISGILLLVIALLLFVHVMDEYVTKREGREYIRLKAYYLEPANTIDIIAMGSSEIQYGYSAPEVYKETGITNYPYAFSVNPVPLWKYELSEIERTQDPKVLVVDINGAVYAGDDYIHSKSALYRLLEGMPLSLNKLKLIYEKEKDHPLECVFPIIKYHDNWTRFSAEEAEDWLDIKHRGYAVLRGARARLYREKLPNEKIYAPDDNTADLRPDAEASLREFLDLCRQSEVEHILFVNFPHIICGEDRYERQKRCNRAAEIIRENGFEYLDLQGKVDLDNERDYFDTDHMSASGQKITCRYLGNYLKKKYDLQPTALSEKDREHWSESISYIDRMYRYYEDYISAHSDHPYKKAPYLLRDDRATLNRLDQMK